MKEDGLMLEGSSFSFFIIVFSKMKNLNKNCVKYFFHHNAVLKPIAEPCGTKFFMSCIRGLPFL